MLYVLTTFLSAFLLFMIQPLMGKLILPWFGGAPAVWTTCMLFFQVTLLGGYTYAHLLASRLRPRGQAWLHVGLLAVALLLMGLLLTRWGSPILPDDTWKPGGDEAPVPLILTLLLLSIGLPYLLLSATSPLLQRWFSLQGHGEKTYRLYAVSNAGSLLGLLSYPFLTERFLALPVQAAVWAVAFAVFAAGCALVALQLRGKREAAEVAPGPGAPAPFTTAGQEPPRPLTILTWLLLTMSTSAMLLAVTNELCQEVAAVPFLWVLPLSLYLLSFIICFDRPGWYSRRWFVVITAFLTLVVLITNFLGIRLKIPTHILSFGAFLFFFCMTCHGELVGLKPAPRHLTLFYLLIALGGALGGIFVGLVAPAIFTSFWEFNVMATVAWVVLAMVFARDKGSFFFTGDRWHFYLLLWFLLYFGLRFSLLFTPLGKGAPGQLFPLWSAGAITAGVVLLLSWLLRKRRFPSSPYWPRILIGAIIFLAECFMVIRIRSTSADSIAADRNFFGTLRVLRTPAVPGRHPAFLRLAHGQINHGVQYQDPQLRREPVSYYGPGTGIATAVRFHPRRLAAPALPLHIGVLGLGTGTMAAFAEPGDRVRFYEINPTVIEYAAGARPYFTYLADSKGETKVVLGDARLALERELRNGEAQKFDILVMDAFSSDSVPVHLLTREALALYSEHLRDEQSILAVNISNRFLDFRDLVASMAADAGFTLRLIDLPVISLRHSPSRWALLCRDPAVLAHPAFAEHSMAWTPRRTVLWTDSFSNLYHLVRRSKAR